MPVLIDLSLDCRLRFEPREGLRRSVCRYVFFCCLLCIYMQAIDRSLSLSLSLCLQVLAPPQPSIAAVKTLLHAKVRCFVLKMMDLIQKS